MVLHSSSRGGIFKNEVSVGFVYIFILWRLEKGHKGLYSESSNFDASSNRGRIQGHINPKVQAKGNSRS